MGDAATFAAVVSFLYACDLELESFVFQTLSKKDMLEKDLFVWNTHVVAADAILAAAAAIINLRGIS